MTHPLISRVLLSLIQTVWLGLLWVAPVQACSNEALRSEIRNLLMEPELFVAAQSLNTKSLWQWYEVQDFSTSWCANQMPNTAAGILLGYLERAHIHGLQQGQFHLHRLSRYWNEISIEAQARRDILLTDAALRYARLLYGIERPLSEIDPEWHIAQDDFDPVLFLQSALASYSFAYSLDRLPPSNPAYEAMVQAYARYRTWLHEQQEWPRIPAGVTLEPGDYSLRVPIVRTRLQRQGYAASVAPGISPDFFDDELAAALRRYQRHHGLTVDGILGQKTVATLNTSLQHRLHQIQFNLQRWHALPRDFGEQYILVNMAGFHLNVVKSGEIAQHMKVIVGREDRATPSFRSAMTYLVINPSWNVPLSIAGKDLLPEQQRDAEFFQRKGIRVYTSWGRGALEIDPGDVDWSRVQAEPFPYRLRQDSGPNNSLGLVKFMLPNPFDIYLHDTPAQALFSRTTRAFSSGCIRVEKPMELARYLLDDEKWQQFPQLLQTGSTQILSLEKPVPVYLVYWTSWVEDDGAVHFRDDFYGRDALMALQKPYPGVDSPTS